MVNIFFYKQKSLNYALLFLYVLIFKLYLFFIPYYPDFDKCFCSFLCKYVETLFHQSKYVIIFISIVTTYIQALIINSLSNKNGFTKQGSFLAGFIFIVFTGALRQFSVVNELTISFFFFLFFSYVFFGAFNIEKPKENIFYASILLGLGSLIYFELLFFELYVLAVIITMFYKKTPLIVISILGVLAPYTYVTLTLFYQDNIILIYNFIETYQNTKSVMLNDVTYLDFVLISYLFIFFVIAFVNKIFMTAETNVKKRIYFSSLIIFLVFFAIIFVFTKENKFIFGYIFSFGFSLFVGHFYSLHKNNIYTKIMFYAFITLVFANQWSFLVL